MLQTARRRWRKALPLLVSVGLMVWLFRQVPFHAVLAAALQLPWQVLVPITVVMVLALYAWDGLCLPAVYGTNRSPFGYLAAIRARGLAYLLGAFNYELGEALVAWRISRVQKTSYIATLSRSVVLAYHDALLLAGAGLAGALVADDLPVAPRVRLLCIVLLAGLLAAGAAIALLPRNLRRRFEATRWGAWLESWTWSRSLRLLLLRVVYYAFFGVYATAVLRISGIELSWAAMLGTIPIVLLAVTLPSVSGLGPRETALCVLLGPEHREVLLAIGLFMSTGQMLSRLAIGLVNLWLCRGRSVFEE